MWTSSLYLTVEKSAKTMESSRVFALALNMQTDILLKRQISLEEKNLARKQMVMVSLVILKKMLNAVW